MTVPAMTINYAVGDFQVRPAERCIYLRGRPVALGARAFDLLLTLIEHRARVVGKDELLALVWPGLVVEEGNLAVQVSTLRKLLGSDAIATIPARGYRFTAPVVEAVPRAVAALLQVPEAQDIDPAPPDPHKQDYERLMRKLRRPANPQNVQPADADEGGWVPAALTPLLGREAALQATQQLLQSTRCLTLTGAGGSGKTRLALALAESARVQSQVGVWWIELDKLGDPKMLAATIAHAMGISDPQKTALQALTEQLQGRKILLVLDNCEHLVQACAELAVQLLRELPLLQLLTTSRESLRIAGEVAWPVPPLDVPDATCPASTDTASESHWQSLLQHASVQLLAQRIRQHDPHFAVTQNNAASLVQICRGLEGLPLALELVAAQVGPLTLAQVAARLDRSLLLMNVGARGGLPHHQTMTAAVDWGYQLLTQAEQALFARLSVFVGGWTAESAVAVCQNTDIGAEEVDALLGRLQRVSMVLASGDESELEGAVRFRMLEPIRQFAFTKLEASGQTDAVKAQLLNWFVNRCKVVATELTGPQQAAGYRFLTSEFNNLRALLAWPELGRRPVALLAGQGPRQRNADLV
jgi:predicted ATPase/DNA-binding winged helix-turn-helix (wHTH) protein